MENTQTSPQENERIRDISFNHQEGEMTMIAHDANDELLLARTNDSPYEETRDEQKLTFSGEYQPTIGIPIPVSQGNQGPLFIADAVGAWAVERMRGRVFLIPFWPFPPHAHIYQSLCSLILAMDGLLLPAGIQRTSWYDHWKERESQPGPQTWPVSWEIALAQLASSIGMPILAVADGAEKWNVALGGRGRESVASSSSEVPMTPDSWDRHIIRVRAQSKLATFLQPAIPPSESLQKPWELAFMPHQGVEKLAPGLRSCAQSEDASVVAFERSDAVFGLGILGRLDWGLDHVYATTLFDSFLRACRSFDYTRQQNAAWKSSRDRICATISHRVEQGQSLLSVPETTYKEKRQHSPHLSASLSITPPFSNGSTGQQERFRQRSQTPTKEELNKIRRQRLKVTSREIGH